MTIIEELGWEDEDDPMNSDLNFGASWGEIPIERSFDTIEEDEEIGEEDIGLEESLKAKKKDEEDAFLLVDQSKEKKLVRPVVPIGKASKEEVLAVEEALDFDGDVFEDFVDENIEKLSMDSSTKLSSRATKKANQKKMLSNDRKAKCPSKRNTRKKAS